jgi:hypothetical protein
MLATARSAPAKEVGLRSPGGREIYSAHETFADALAHDTRRFVAEVAAGQAPEGNLALLIGALNIPIENLDAYVGVGLEMNPARTYSASLRYTLHVAGARPYLCAGYLFKDTYDVGVVSHNAFMEVGHRWLLHQTYHVLVGAGVRRILTTSVEPQSLLRDPAIDPELLSRSLADIPGWAPTVVIRFSRAF